MRVPFKWLKDFVDLEGVTADALAEKLTAAGVAVEHVEKRNKGVSGVVVGHIKDLGQHPNADRLRIAQVDVGNGKMLQIVTGAPNVKQDDRVPVALVGAMVFKEGKPAEIKDSKLRGEPSSGMMCSADELNITIKDLPVEQREGVLIFPADTPPGANVLDLMSIDDEVLILEPFANRADFLSILGVAREAAAALGRPLKPLDLEFPESEQNAADRVQVSIADYSLCPRYTARIIDSVKVGQTPLWMQGRLNAAGVRSVNNVVDITNYVMLETGQPLHAFDDDRVRGHHIEVRAARNDEKMVSIDGVERALDERMLVIADGEGPVAIAGVMGGLDSEVSNATTRVLLESANFNSASVRRTSNRLALRSESSKRFEKGLDYQQADLGSRRACALLAKLCGGVAARGLVDAGRGAPDPVHLTLRPERVNHILGAQISAPRMAEILRGLHFEVDSALKVWVPSFRLDVRREEDLVEEIARHYGYDNIPGALPRAGAAAGASSPIDRAEEWLRDVLLGYTLTEAITLGLIDPTAYARLGLSEIDMIGVKNPLVADQKALRTSLLPHLVQAVVHNLNARAHTVRLFEISRVYLGAKAREVRRLGVAVAGAAQRTHFSEPAAAHPALGFFHLKGVIDEVLRRMGLQATWAPHLDAGNTYHPGKVASLQVNGVDIGVAGALHPQVQEALDVTQEILVAEINLDFLLEHAAVRVVKYQPIARFPEVERDLALVVDEGVQSGRVADTLRGAGGPHLRDLRCFDIYRGSQVPQGHKSLAFSMTFASHERTLTDADIDAAMQAMVASARSVVGASVRG